ncbi:MAG: Sb-PDE family phosphodiesterase [Alphaproteobacteria bacterium]
MQRHAIISLIAGLFLTVIAPALAGGLPEPVVFPDTADGRKALAVDLHMHTVFSDGAVWPTMRVEEARRDGLALIAITDHLEWQPKLDDIPHPDRNRAFEVASTAAERAGVIVINGAEVTRGMPVGHINAVFLKDVNPLLPETISARTGAEFADRFDEGTPDTLASARASLEAANAQGGFVFINHPAWTGQAPDGIARLSDFHRTMIEEGLIHGIEVNNGAMYSEDAFQIALDHNLAILGVSDIHGLVAYDYEHAKNGLYRDDAAAGHRTVTLVLTGETSAEAVKAALEARETVSLMARTLYGREAPLRAVVDGALDAVLGAADPSFEGPTSVYPLTITNTAPIPFTLRVTSDQGFAGHSRLFTVPAKGSVTVRMTAVTDPDNLITLPVEVINAYAAPEMPLALDLAVARVEG